MGNDVVLALVVVTGLCFDFTNGFHDTANAMATSIATKALGPLGKGLVEIEPPQGFAAESSSAAVILLSAHFGYSLSTTQVATGSILGCGLGKKGAQVRWNVAGRMAVAWIITLPSSPPSTTSAVRPARQPAD